MFGKYFLHNAHLGKGENMSENILLANEMVEQYHRNMDLARCTIEIDIKKRL